MIKSIVTKGNSQCLASLVHLQCTPVSWDSANNVAMLYLILFIEMGSLPVENKGNEEIRWKITNQDDRVEGTGSMEKERGFEAIQRLGSRGLYLTRLLHFSTRLC